jgi:putative glutathione S-transferase
MAEPAPQAKPLGFTHTVSKDSPYFQPESGRYHLYTAHACPFAQRAYITLKLKGLEDHISISVAHPTWQKTKPEVDDHMGWVFKNEDDEPVKSAQGHGSFSCKGCIPDTVNNCKTVREIYDLTGQKPDRFTIPILWDKKLKAIVNNESIELIRILNSSFNDFARNPDFDVIPEELRSKIDEAKKWLEGIVVGIYTAGYAESQAEYEEGIRILFPALDRLEEVLSKSRYICGDRLTEADILVFPFLSRFDEIYHIYFKCNKKKIIDYPNILNYCRDVYQTPGLADTVFMDHSKMTLFSSPVPIFSAYAIVPIGPDFVGAMKEKHNRDRF